MCNSSEWFFSENPDNHRRGYKTTPPRWVSTLAETTELGWFSEIFDPFKFTFYVSHSRKLIRMGDIWIGMGPKKPESGEFGASESRRQEEEPTRCVQFSRNVP